MEEVKEVPGFMQRHFGRAFIELGLGNPGAIIAGFKPVKRDCRMAPPLLGFPEYMGKNRNKEINVNDADDFYASAKFQGLEVLDEFGRITLLPVWVNARLGQPLGGQVDGGQIQVAGHMRGYDFDDKRWDGSQCNEADGFCLHMRLRITPAEFVFVDFFVQRGSVDLKNPGGLAHVAAGFV